MPHIAIIQNDRHIKCNNQQSYLIYAPYHPHSEKKLAKGHSIFWYKSWV